MVDVGGYNYTRPRGPISAMFCSPGPCYALPTLVGFIDHDPRSVHFRGPAYSFGIKHWWPIETIGPGPAKYFVDPKLYINGWDGAPHWSFGLLIKPLNPFLTPGPPTYCTEKVVAHLYHAPEWSFGLRTKGFIPFPTPAPNAYTLDPMFGPKTIRAGKFQAPSYTMGYRLAIGSFWQDLARMYRRSVGLLIDFCACLFFGVSLLLVIGPFSESLLAEGMVALRGGQVREFDDGLTECLSCSWC